MEDIFIFLFLFLLSGFFSGTETAFTSFNEYSLASIKCSNKKLNYLTNLIKDKQSVIAALLVGNNIVNTVLAVYAGVVSNKLLVETKIFPASAGPIIASAFTVVFLLIFGEVLPKQFGQVFAKGWCVNATYLLHFLVIVLKPITRAMNLLSNFVLKLLPVNKNDDAPTIDELMMMAKDSEKAGNIDSMERNLMYSSSQINDLTAEDVMIHKNKIIAASSNVKPDELIGLFKTHLYSRIPIYRNSIDDIIGIFNIKECLHLDEEKKETFDISKHLIKPIFVPGNVTIGSLMEQMKNTRVHMAVVVSEYGVTDGIVTLENILERIIGLIGDEYDDDSDNPFYIHKKNDEIVDIEIDGTLSLQDLSKVLKIEFPPEVHHKVNTVNGFLIDKKGDFLDVNDVFVYENYEFKVLSIKGRCADKIKVTRSASVEKHR